IRMDSVADHPLDCMNDFLTATVVEGKGQYQLVVIPGQLNRAPYRILEVRIQRAEVANVPELGSLSMELLGLGFDCAGQDLHDSLDLFLRSAPVLGRERPEGQVLDPELSGLEGYPPDVLRAGFVPGQTGQPAQRSPAPIAVHDDGDVIGNPAG